MVRIKEIFTSIQGEGPFVGYKQLFVRFCRCNLNCNYCDTSFKDGDEYTTEQLADICKSNLDCHSVSLTGGEPLLEVDFLKEFLPQCQLPVYLETNGTLYSNLEKIINYVDYISADIKLPSCTKNNNLFSEHDKFFEIASKKLLFAKAVFNENINDIEIAEMCKLCKKYDIELVLQPMMIKDKPSVNSDFMVEILDKCLKLYPKVRIIPQVHKFINII